MTLGALIGLLPVTLLFLWGTGVVLFESFKRRLIDPGAFMLVLGIVVVSTFCLGCGWWIYAQAMHPRPQLRRHPVLLLGWVIGVLWGIGWALLWDVQLRLSHLVFLLPGVITGAMYRVTWKRERQRRAQSMQSTA